MIIARVHNGYIFLLTVLVVGAIASATAVSLLLLGWAAEQNGILIVQSGQAYEYAHTCAERALRSLRSDVGYIGSGSITFSRGTCAIHAIGGEGNENRNICVEGFSGSSTHRMQLDVAQLLPSVIIRQWEEVDSFTDCP